ncbi:MAG: DUF5715 family protein [Pyrinomonadaceae bacterium]
MTKSKRRFLALMLISVATGIAVWAALHFTVRRWNQTASLEPANLRSVDELWTEGVEKIKAVRDESESKVAIEVPAELRHYEERRWFLATQVAEVHKHNVQSCQDYLELAAMIQRGEIVSVPAATEDYILFGVGAKADDGPFSRYEGDQDIELYDENQLREAYARLDSNRDNLQKEIAALNSGSGKNRDRAKQREAQKEIAARQQQLKSIEEKKASLDQSYGSVESRQRLFSGYQALQNLAKNFSGRSYDLTKATERQALKLSMLRSLRPAAFKVMKEIAADYHRAFDRPLPVSSLVRPEQYQHVLRRYNRAATTIETPPHSTGLAFDIDYRYMSPAEQNFVMTKLSRLKNESRIEVLRERNANYHVFVFIDGNRPSDDLITASLKEVGPPAEEANHAIETKSNAPNQSKRVTKKMAKSQPKSAAKQRVRGKR